MALHPSAVTWYAALQPSQAQSLPRVSNAALHMFAQCGQGLAQVRGLSMFEVQAACVSPLPGTSRQPGPCFL